MKGQETFEVLTSHSLKKEGGGVTYGTRGVRKVKMTAFVKPVCIWVIKLFFPFPSFVGMGRLGWAPTFFGYGPECLMTFLLLHYEL